MTQEDSALPIQEDAAPVSAEGQQAADASGAEDRVRELEARVAELERSLATEREAANDYMQRWQRAQADFANFKRRNQQEQEQREMLAVGRILAAMFPALDSFERAFHTLPPSLRYFSWIDGMGLIEMQLRRALEVHEVKPVQAVPGGAFDPLRHESIGAVETSEYPEGQIAAVVQTGYELRGFILRPALVQLAKAPVSPTPDAPIAAEAGASHTEESRDVTDDIATDSAPSATAGAGSRSNREDS
ncbi:MAG TPA: nucleotide exchange factor GrpE [Ktedonobacterales bacterium]